MCNTEEKKVKEFGKKTYVNKNKIRQQNMYMDAQRKIKKLR